MAEDSEEQIENLSAFNAGIEYLKNIVGIEREIIKARLVKDYALWNNLLDSYWMELVEWMDEKELEEQNNLRTEQHEAWKKIKEAISKKKGSFPTEYVEIFVKRFLSLKKIVHIKGLRMPKTEDQRGMPSLMRPAKYNRRF